MKIILKFIIILFFIYNNSLLAQEKKKVLVLHSYHQSYKWTDDINKGINTIIKNGNSNVEIFVEYMDTKRFIEENYYKELVKLYSLKYQFTNLDVIIASDNNAFNFLKKYSKTIFSNTPVIISGINHLKKEEIENFPNFRAISESADFRKNYDLILKLHPNVKNIYTITDTTTTGKEIKDEALKVILSYPNKKINFHITDNANYEELKSIIKNIPENSAILFTFFFRDSNGNFYEYYEISEMINKISNIPLYGVWDFSLDNGIIGGFLTSGYFQGKTAGLMAKKILDGKPLEDIENMYRSPNQYMFDYEQIEKYKIDINKIPKSSYKINKKLSFFEKYKSEILMLSALFLLLILFIFILLINIKKRKKAEVIIKKQLKFQQELIDNVDVAIYYKNTKEEYIGCNKAFENLVEIKKSDILGKKAEDLIEKEQSEIYHQKDLELLETGKAQKYEGIHYTPYKEKKDLLFYKNIFYDDDNKINGIIGAIFDVTEIKQVTKELDILNKNLEEEVKIRTLELKNTNDELEDSNEELQTTIHNLKHTQEKLIESEKMASLGSLVAGVAHEINTPVGIGLTGITHFLEEIDKVRIDYENNEMSENRFTTFLNESENIASLINTNLDKTAHLVRSFKQVAVDQTNDEEREINLKEYIYEVLFSIGNITKKTNLSINVFCDEDINILTYPGSISQVITNLVINSIIHGFEEAEKGYITIEVTQKENETIELSYKDNGKGIKKENLSKIFDPFFTTNRIKGGTGLGLNIIYNIITNMLNGSIECKSEENNGVEFTIIFKTKNKI